MATFLVLDENTLGYSENYSPDKSFCSMIVMRADCLRGGDPTTMDRSVLVNIAKARIATKEDFEHFKVLCPY